MMYHRICSFAATVVVVAFSHTGLVAAERLKILALHGGGGSPVGFQKSKGMVDLEAALPEFEFVYAEGGFRVATSKARNKQSLNAQKDKGESESFLWIPDPPSKDEPTTSPNVANASIVNLSNIVDEQGPFYAILGFSQGAAFVPIYLSRAPTGSFEKAVMFSGYLTETHLGLLDSVQGASPFGDISSLIWIGEQDFVINPSLTEATIPEFASPTVIRSPTGGHTVPGTWDDTFEEVVTFLKDEESVDTDASAPVSESPPDEDMAGDDEKDDSSGVRTTEGSIVLLLSSTLFGALALLTWS